MTNLKRMNELLPVLESDRKIRREFDEGMKELEGVVSLVVSNTTFPVKVYGFTYWIGDELYIRFSTKKNSKFLDKSVAIRAIDKIINIYKDKVLKKILMYAMIHLKSGSIRVDYENMIIYHTNLQIVNENKQYLEKLGFRLEQQVR